MSRCPFCDQKPANCDCSPEALRMHNTILDNETELAALRDELARVKGHLKTMITDSCEDREAMTDLCRKAGIHDSQINGDSHGVPGTMDLADMLAAKLAAAVAERDELREALRPFAESVKDHDSSNTVHGVPIDDETKLADYETVWGKWLTIAHVRRAAELVARLDTTTGGVKHKGATDEN